VKVLMKNLNVNLQMAEQSKLERKWHDMKDHVTKTRKELNGMAICPFAGAGFAKDEIAVHWVKQNMFDKANEVIKNYPADKKLVLCIGDPNDYTLEQLEKWEQENQSNAVKNNLYIYTSYKSEDKQRSQHGPVAGLNSGNKGLAIIQIQTLDDLNKKSEWLHKNTKYYDNWNKNYYDAIVKRRYSDSNYNSKDFEK